MIPGKEHGKGQGENTSHALQERVKELSCIYDINCIFDRCSGESDEVFQCIAELIPPAWQYPEIASARILIDDREFRSQGFAEGRPHQVAEILIEGRRRGFVEVAYSEQKPLMDEGPFLREERSLIDAIARQIAVIAERLQAEKERVSLEKQLMHADRLATIGQLAAGVAHELNEPLSAILGFAQILNKDSRIPEESKHDLRKIVSASLYAREIIKKLLLFARQSPTFKGSVSINDVVTAATDLFTPQFEMEGIELKCDLHPGMPMIEADGGQLTQVLVNLIANAVQAMPGGGKLTLRTELREGEIICRVEDTGSGMPEEVLDKLFMPFFTTKDVNQGTGLGLPVSHGIIAAHGGTIRAESSPGKGSTFTIRLPIDPRTDPEEKGAP